MGVTIASQALKCGTHNVTTCKVNYVITEHLQSSALWLLGEVRVCVYQWDVHTRNTGVWGRLPQPSEVLTLATAKPGDPSPNCVRGGSVASDPHIGR